MGIDVSSIVGYNTRQDYSSLFTSLPTRSGNTLGATNLNFLADYTSIKNGSYAKLMNSYYGPEKSAGSSFLNSISTINKETSPADQANKVRAKDVETSAEGLKVSVDKLLATGKDSLFKEKTVTTKDENGLETTKTEVDRDAIYNALSSFVKNYNNVLDKADTANNTAINGRVKSLTDMTAANSKMLGDIGITTDKNGRLSLDKETFNKTDVSSVKNLFQGNSSYGFRASAQASWIDFTAASEATKSFSYNADGRFAKSFNVETLFGSYM